MKIKKNIFFVFCFCFLFLFFVFVFCFCFFVFGFYGVALHLNSFSGSSSSSTSVSASESVVQSFEEESVVQSFEEESDEFSNKRLDTLESVNGSDVGKGDAGKYGVETMLTVVSPLMSQIGEKAD